MIVCIRVYREWVLGNVGGPGYYSMGWFGMRGVLRKLLKVLSIFWDPNLQELLDIFKVTILVM